MVEDNSDLRGDTMKVVSYVIFGKLVHETHFPKGMPFMGGFYVDEEQGDIIKGTLIDPYGTSKIHGHFTSDKLEGEKIDIEGVYEEKRRDFQYELEGKGGFYEGIYKEGWVNPCGRLEDVRIIRLGTLESNTDGKLFSNLPGIEEILKEPVVSSSENEDIEEDLPF